MLPQSLLITASTTLLAVVVLTCELGAQARGGSRGSTTTLGAAASVASAATMKAQALRAEGKSAADAATAIRAQLGTSAADLAAAFLAVGYTAAETAVGLRDGYSASVRPTIEALARGGFERAAFIKGVRSAFANAQPADFLVALRDLGAPYADVVKAVRAEYQLNDGATAQAMRAAATEYAIAAEVLRESFGMGVDAVADALHKGGFQIDEVVRALVSSFNASADQIAAALLKAGAPRQAVAQTLHRTLSQNAAQVVALLAPRMNTAELIQAMRAGLGTTAADMATLFRARGMAAPDFVKPLASIYSLTSDAALTALADAGYDREQQIAAAHRGLNGGIDFAADYLHRQKVSAVVGVNVLSKEFTASARDVSTALIRAGYKVDEIALGLKDGLGYTAVQTAAVLKDLQLNAAQIGAALTQVFQLNMTDLAQVLASVGL